MMQRSPEFKPEYNCYIADLVNGLPVNPDAPDGSVVRVFDGTVTPKKLAMIFEKIDGVWHKY